MPISNPFDILFAFRDGCVSHRGDGLPCLGGSMEHGSIMQETETGSLRSVKMTLSQTRAAQRSHFSIFRRNATILKIRPVLDHAWTIPITKLSRWIPPLLVHRLCQWI